VLAAVAVVAAALPARADLVLEFIEVGAINAPASTGPALTSLNMEPGTTRFLQIALRDTTGNTVAWSLNGNDANPAGPGSLGLASFLLRFTGLPGIAENPAPTAGNVNARLVDQINYGPLFAGTSPPAFTNFGGLLQFGSEPGAVPDPANQNRIALFNLRVNAIGAGAGAFTLSDSNPAPSSIENSTIRDADLGGVPNPGTIEGIDQLIFGPGSANVFSLPVTVVPEPSSMALAGLALAGFGYRKLRRKKA